MNRNFLLAGILLVSTSSMARPFNNPLPSSALEFQSLSTDTRIAVDAGYLRFFTNAEERITVDNGGNVGIGITDPGNYKLNVVGMAKVGSSLDVGYSRPADGSTEGLFVNGVNDYNTSFQFATRTWSASHAILFGAYKSATQVNGSLATVGNTKFTHGPGAYSGGAGMIHYHGNGGGIIFYVSQVSTGAGTNVNWGTPKLFIKRTGTIGINTLDPSDTYKLHVTGKTYSTSFHTAANTYADFVFEDDYQLRPLEEVENYIEKNHHLPEIPSEAEAKANGVNLQEMQVKLLQKIEELTLYVIEQNKQIEAQQQRIGKLESEVAKGE